MSKPNQPKIKIKPTPVELVIESLGMLALILMIVLPIAYYGDLPEQIPQHYGPDGKPDSFGSKISIGLLPAIGLVLYVGLTVLNLFPWVFNFPVRITPQNAEKQYRIATQSIRWLKVLITVLFTYITYTSIKTALGVRNGLDLVFMIILLGLIVATIIVMVFKSVKNK